MFNLGTCSEKFRTYLHSLSLGDSLKFPCRELLVLEYLPWGDNVMLCYRDLDEGDVSVDR